MSGDAGNAHSKEILDVRKVIEKSTSKVSLRDLEKKGFRQVKVLRAGDINQLIYKAVQTVLAKSPVSGASEAERQRILDESRSEYEKQLKAAQLAAAAAEKLEVEKSELEARGREIEEAKKRLEQKVHELNAQLAGRQRAIEEDKRQFDRDKQALYEKGLDTVNAAAKHYQVQIDELRGKLDDAEKRAAEAEQGAGGEDMDLLRQELALANQKVAESNARLADMFSMIMSKLQETPAPVAAAASPDLEKQLRSFQQSLSDQMRRIAGSAKGGGFDSDVNLAGLFVGGEDVKLETNIQDIAVKEQSAKGVKDKLSKLKNLRSGGAQK